MRAQYGAPRDEAFQEAISPRGKKGRRVRVFGGDGGIVANERPRERHEETSALELSTVLLVVGLFGQIIMEFRRLTGGVEFQPGLFYNPTMLKALVVMFMSAPAIGVVLFHLSVMVRAFTNTPLRICSSLAGLGIYFVVYQVLFILFGGFAHLQVNAVDFYCVRQAKGNEKRCAQAKGRVLEMPTSHRKLLARTSRWYSRLNQRELQADMALIALLTDTSKPRK